MNAKRPDYIFPLDHGGPQPFGAAVPPRHNLRHTATQAAKFVFLQTIQLITLSLFAHWFDRTMQWRTMLALMLGGGFAAGVLVRDRSAPARAIMPDLTSLTRLKYKQRHAPRGF